MRTIFRKLMASQTGATAVEYGLILSLIVLAIVGVLSQVATKTNSLWYHVSNEVNNH